jgi:hypothetical protein
VLRLSQVAIRDVEGLDRAACETVQEFLEMTTRAPTLAARSWSAGRNAARAAARRPTRHGASTSVLTSASATDASSPGAGGGPISFGMVLSIVWLVGSRLRANPLYGLRIIDGSVRGLKPVRLKISAPMFEVLAAR